MKVAVIPFLLGLVLVLVPAAAETPPTPAPAVTYAPGPVVTEVGFLDADLTWLRDVADLLSPGGFTFLGRRDADHWLGLSNKGTFWLLQIHDQTNGFNFRAMVSPRTGRITVEKGVDWPDGDRNADATKAANLAVGYVQRARKAEGLFPAAGSSPASLSPSHDGMASAVPASPTTHDAGASAHGDLTVGNGGAEFWQRLVDGNLRFVSGKVIHPNQSMARIDETAKGQKPFAIVVSCSDSRVPPEILFDQGIGDLFVVRTAGEVVTEVELGSIEYAVEHLGATYLVVLGHKRCGAVDATLKGGDLPPNIEAIAAQIRPAVEAARFFKGDPLDNAVRENAQMVLAKVKGSAILSEALHAGKLNVKAAYYDIDSGKVAALP